MQWADERPEMTTEAGGGTTILLCAGRIAPEQLPRVGVQSHAMIPVNGKPVIGWILDDLLRKGCSSARIVVRADDHALTRFVRRVFGRRLELQVVELADSNSILCSLSAGLGAGAVTGPLRLVLGDTLITDTFAGDLDFVYVGPVQQGRRWCLVRTDSDDRILEYLDKPDLGIGHYNAIAGYYHFVDPALFQLCLSQAIEAGERELIGVLRRCGERRELFARQTTNWYDFGHIDRLVDARRRLLKPRTFNLLKVDPVLNTITKASAKKGKLRDELRWYQALPPLLQVLTPRIVDHRECDDHLELVQEYYGYPTLAELFVFADLGRVAWTSILRQVLRVHEQLRQHKGEAGACDPRPVYLDKTFSRIAEWASQDARWRALVERETVAFNGCELRGIRVLEPEIRRRVAGLCESVDVCVVHGDFCFSNILFDITTQIVRLIDPRGSFGHQGIHGDPRYDIAKLRHSVHGLYDFIVADMFDLEEEGGSYSVEIYAERAVAGVVADFDTLVADLGYDRDDIRLIEGLLFVSMPALHTESARRQQVMYLQGLAILNEVVDAHCS